MVNKYTTRLGGPCTVVACALILLLLLAIPLHLRAQQPPQLPQPPEQPDDGEPPAPKPPPPNPLDSVGPPPSPDADEDEYPVGWILAGFAVTFLMCGLVIRAIVKRKRRKDAEAAEAAVVPEHGLILNGYRFQTHLSTGATSQVWEVVEVSSGRHFAMKTLLQKTATDPELRQALYHEAEVGRQMAHQNIVRIMRIQRHPYNPNFVMEFFPSGSLKLKIMHKQHTWIRDNVDGILRQTATALAFMNAQGWVHRDIKPENILVNAAGEVRLIDFALALQIPKGWWNKRFKKPKCQGTRSYMSPEQILCKPFDGRSDIYSFGATAYEIVTGRPPFRGADNRDLLQKHLHEKPVSPQVHNPDVTKEFADLVLQMLAKKPSDRPSDFHVVLMKLKTIKVFKNQITQPTSRR